jgi:tripartite-type tricarboxylate transporter receptor subunit TctC
MKLFARTLAMTALCLSAALPAAAQDWPSRPIRLIVPLAPGGGGDVTARVVAAELSNRLKQTVVVENRPGASSTVGTQAAAKSAPDGYTFIMVTDFHAINAALDRQKLLPAPLPYDSLKDFVPVGRLVDLQIVLMANPKLGLAKVSDLMARAKQSKETPLSAGHLGIGSPHYLGFLLLQQMGGVSFTEVPYQGSGPATVALAGGQVDLAFGAVGAASELAKAGKATMLGVSGPRRDPRAPEVPTIAESGLPGFSVLSWMGVLAPAGTPAPIVQRMSSEIRSTLADPAVAAKLTAAGMAVSPSTSEQFGELIRADIDKLQAVYQKVGAGDAKR